ncbi:response regulator receiver domain-containing protein [Halanaerobium saccharolyticum]|uniref:Stage 0 sporulation protein A homolog n=1 Tax=Halanaerobium saccharolyticum TaxID=43595 RepID=A0A4R7Z6G6_9FIRM|nr:response regulator receiver domain-containing protein [Halanaerobium saccharolyticum]TDW06393.1 response regulator receiver domain-containing protein [Halanaerobium saccharolyticum]TDX61641.1 response regulator receiver domain-containing protein [Halanaerobium saccharolyticum]
MPEMNGLEMAEEIRKNNQKTKIIVLSGYDKFEYAKKLIKENREIKFYQIAEAVGFNDYKYFSTIFKKYTGTTPSKYKNNLY